jgi:hypothetical protein
MRAHPPRLPAALALLGATLAVLAGCGKGMSSASTRTGAGAGDFGVAPEARGVLSVSTKNTTRLGGADPVSDAAAVAQTVYPGLTPATRPQAIAIVDERDWPAALVASALASTPLGAPLLYAEDGALPGASEDALRAMHPVGASALGRAQVVRIATAAALPAGYRVRDVAAEIAAGHLPAAAGEDQTEAAAVELAVDVQKLVDEVRGRRSRAVLIVPGDTPHALQAPAAGLAAESGAPILFVTRSRVPAATSAALRTLAHPTIYVIAPTMLDARAYAELKRLGTVVRVSESSETGESPSATEAADPVQNAIAIARFSNGSFGWGIHEAGHGLVFANASRPLDGPASAPLSAHGDYGPLLLLADSESLPEPLTRYLSNIEPGYTAAVPPVRDVYNHGWLIGDEQAISARAQAELDTVLEIAPRQPSAGERAVTQGE